MRKIIPLKYCPVFARVRIQAPHVFAQKLIPQELSPACIGFCRGVWRRPELSERLGVIGPPYGFQVKFVSKILAHNRVYHQKMDIDNLRRVECPTSSKTQAKCRKKNIEIEIWPRSKLDITKLTSTTHSRTTSTRESGPLDQGALCFVLRDIRMDQWPLKFVQSCPGDSHLLVHGWLLPASSQPQRLIRRKHLDRPVIRTP